MNADAYGASPHDYPDEYLEPRVIPDRPMCRHELRRWMEAALQARVLVELEAEDA